MLLRRVGNALVNLVKAPGRIKEIHENLVLLADVRSLKDAVHAHHEQTRWAEYFSEVAAVNSATLLRQSAAVSAPYRVLFIIHHIGACSSILPLIRRLSTDPDFEVVVASIIPKFRGYDGAETHLIDEELDRLEVSHVRLPFPHVHRSLRIIEGLAPDLVFRQSQWEGDYDDAFRMPSLDFTRMCYIPYETMNLLTVVAGPTTDSALTSQLHSVAWRVYWANELTMRESEALMGHDMPNYVVAGHPKQQYIREATPWWPIEPSGRVDGRVLWSAHHSVDDGWTNFGLFPEMTRGMMQWVRTHKTIQVCLMIHPLLRPVLDDGKCPQMSKAEADAWFKEWDRLPNTSVYVGADYAGLFKESDAMITDGISMLLEYQIANKPIVFVERQGHRPFNELGNITMKGVHRVAKIDQAIALVKTWLAGETDELAAAQHDVVARLFAHEDATDRIVTDMKAGLAALAVAPQSVTPPAIMSQTVTTEMITSQTVTDQVVAS